MSPPSTHSGAAAASDVSSMPINPMSWDSGSQDTVTSPGRGPVRRRIASTLAPSVARSKRIALGRLVEPEVNWVMPNPRE